MTKCVLKQNRTSMKIGRGKKEEGKKATNCIIYSKHIKAYSTDFTVIFLFC